MGYTERFGLNWVNFTDLNRAVFRKDSGKFYEKVVTGHAVENSFVIRSSFKNLCLSFYLLVIILSF